MPKQFLDYQGLRHKPELLIFLEQIHLAPLVQKLLNQDKFAFRSWGDSQKYFFLICIVVTLHLDEEHILIRRQQTFYSLPIYQQIIQLLDSQKTLQLPQKKSHHIRKPHYSFLEQIAHLPL